MSPEAPTPGGLPDPHAIEKKIFKAAIINADELVESQARDVGDAKMTESKEDRSGNRVMRTLKRIWKHNLAQNFYRNREVSRAKESILESRDLYAGEKEFDPDKNAPAGKASDGAMNAIIDRFTSEYEDEEILHKGESRHKLEDQEQQEANGKIKELIEEYITKNRDAAWFDEAKKRVLSRYDKRVNSEKSLYADNLFAIAEEVKQAVEHGTKLEELDYDVEVILGNARESLSTEAHLNAFEQGLEKIKNTTVGKYLANHGTALSIVAGLYDFGRKAIQKTTSSKLLQVATFGATAALAGGVSALNEHSRFTHERAQHQRESAKGMEFKEKDMKRRKEMEENSYDTKKASSIIEDLDNDLAKIHDGNTSPEELNAVMARLADLESRVKLNNQQNIDLITYDKYTTMEKDNTAILLKSAELKVAIRKGSFTFEEKATEEGKEPTPIDFDTRLAQLTEAQKIQLLGGNHGITKKDELFKEQRRSHVKRAFWTTALTSVAIGTAFQEIRAAFDSSQDGIIEGTYKHFFDKNGLVKNGTSLEALRRWVTGDQTNAMMAHDATHFVEGTLPGGHHIQLPEGVTLRQVPGTNTFDVVKTDGEVIVPSVHIAFGADGKLTPETIREFTKSGIVGTSGSFGEKITVPTHESAEDYLKDHTKGTERIHRGVWYNNDTEAFDKGELTPQWGGENGTGVDANGNYVFNLSHMRADGSFHGATSINAPEQIKQGGLKMIFSLSNDTQHEVFKVDVDVNGNAIIDKDSELAKLMFERQPNGHALFTGRFGEVVHVTGTAADGGENVDILATKEGLGKEFIDSTVTKDTTEIKTFLDIPDKSTMDLPPIFPIGARRPLERGEYKTNTKIEPDRPRTRELGKILPDAPEEASAAGGEPIPDGGFRSGVVIDTIYSPETGGFSGKHEYQAAKDTNYIYGFVGVDRKKIDSRLKEVKKHAHPEVFIFEHDKATREASQKQLEAIKKWYPKVKFTYIELPKGMTKLQPKALKEYTNKRFEYIIKNSEVDKKVRHELHTTTGLTPDSLGVISPTEWEKFIETAEVSPDRLQNIADKMKSRTKLSHEEQSMYTEHSETIKKLLKK